MIFVKIWNKNFTPTILSLFWFYFQLASPPPLPHPHLKVVELAESFNEIGEAATGQIIDLRSKLISLLHTIMMENVVMGAVGVLSAIVQGATQSMAWLTVRAISKLANLSVITRRRRSPRESMVLRQRSYVFNNNGLEESNLGKREAKEHFCQNTGAGISTNGISTN